MTCTAALAAAASSPGVRSAAAAPTPPATGYPEPARAAGGDNVLAALPRPRECPPSNGRAPRPSGYVRLSRLPSRKADDPYVKGEPRSVALRFVNRKKQRFRIFISARTDAAIRRYVNSAAVCLEWIRLPKPLPAVLEPVSFVAPLETAAVDATGLSREELKARLASLPASATFADVVASGGQDPAAVIDAAAAVVSSALAAQVDAGQLTEAEVAALDIPDLLRRLAEEPGAPSFFGSADVPGGAAAAGAFLRTDRRGSVLVTFQALPPLPQRSWIWLGVDPPINNGTIHGYRAKCATHASVEMRVTAGKTHLKFWRTPGGLIREKTVSAAVGTTGYWHKSNTGSPRSYDINVTGKQNDSEYNLHGGWSPGKGGGC
jgi:hypothetical protein